MHLRVVLAGTHQMFRQTEFARHGHQPAHVLAEDDADHLAFHAAHAGSAAYCAEVGRVAELMRTVALLARCPLLVCGRPTLRGITVQEKL